jgi:putative transposase
MIKPSSDKTFRRLLRLKNYDYRNLGGYFITVCAHQQKHLFGEVINDEMKLNEAGIAVESVWNDLPVHYSNVELDQFVIMPNHFHGIMVLCRPLGAGLKPAPTNLRIHGLPEIVRALKTFSARKINQMSKKTGQPIWQRGYYEHVIRTDASIGRIREYIVNNHLSWHLDRENLERTGDDDFDKYFRGTKNVGAGFKPALNGNRI